jgi:hypothetical protein
MVGVERDVGVLEEEAQRRLPVQGVVVAAS